METIKITVENGCVIDVENLPENYNYEIIDHDIIDYEPLPQKMVDDSNKEKMLQKIADRNGF
jgi:hypothetical protein